MPGILRKQQGSHCAWPVRERAVGERSKSYRKHDCVGPVYTFLKNRELAFTT